MNHEVQIALRAMADEIKERGLLVPRGVALATGGTWSRYTGPRGGHGWRSTSTGRIVYQADEPGANQHKGESQPERVPAESESTPSVPLSQDTHTSEGFLPFHAILTGDLGYVDGFPVRRTADDTWRLETPTGHVTGGPDDVQAHIDELKRHEANAKPMLDAALARADAYDEPNFFTAPDRVHADARAFEALPDGALVVSLFDDSRGRLGRIVRTPEGNRVKLHGVEGWASNDVEPLEASQSWRAGHAPAAPPPPRLRQGMLFSADGRAWVHLETSVGAWAELLERLRDEPDSPIPNSDQIDDYRAGLWLPVESSNVAAIRYLPQDEALEVEYHGGKGYSAFYRYEDISPEEAEDFANAPSKGGWVWDNLRERGSATGHQKPYSFISGPSSYQPQWMKGVALSAEFVGPHGKIGTRDAAGNVQYELASSWAPPKKGVPQTKSSAGAGAAPAKPKTEGARCPAGYTHANPLTFAGKEYVGGEWIPAEAFEQATAEEKAKFAKGDVREHDLEGSGGSSGGSGLPGGQRSGAEPGTAPAPALPGPGDGAGRGPEAVPGSTGVSGIRTDAPDGGAGNGAADGAGVGIGGPVPGAAGRAGSAGTVGSGRRAGRNKRRRDADVGADEADPGLFAESLSEPASPANPTDLAAGNWHYPNRDFIAGGLKAKFRANIAALKALQTIQAEGRDAATPEEQDAMSRYVGWGQFPALFNDYSDLADINKGRRKEGLADLPYDYDQRDEWAKEREELKSLLTDDEWVSARRSTINAHYTHPDIVDAHWQAAQRLGFNGGRFLETSAGVGYYLGLMPTELAAKTRASAVELDQATGRLAKLLYPSASVHIQGFQDHQSPDNFYDLVASNVPFGAYKVHDPRYNKHQANIHDYFFLKSADVVRPGGLVMHITSTGTLDKPNSAIREELAKTCDLVSAIRFPGGAHQENAGTEVVTDMLILRKRLPGEVPGDQSWLKTTTVPDPAGGEPIPVNAYFAAHPEQILGTLDRTGTMYRENNVNVSKTDDYKERLAAAIARLPEGAYTAQPKITAAFEPERMPAPGDVKDGGYKIDGGKLFQRQAAALVEQKSNAKALERIKGQLLIRDSVREVLNLQLAGHDATEARAMLNTAYDAYVAQHGPLHERANKLAMRSDPDHPVLLALEKWNEKTGTATKADMFHKDTVRHIAKVTHAGSVAEGVGISLHENGRVDIDHIAQLTGKHRDEVAQEMLANGHAFEDPSDGWKPRDQYLSGNVRRKLTMARAAAAADPKFAANVEALEKVQPADVDYSDIEVRLGAPWVPPSDIQAFAAHLLDGEPDHFKVSRLATTGEWMAKYTPRGERYHARSQTANEVWATQYASFDELLEAGLNNAPITITGRSPDGKQVVNVEATRDAQAKAQEIKDAFKSWIWDNDERRDRLHRYYNDNFNNIVPIKYDGSHQSFPGMNPAWAERLHPHIRNFAWQVVTTGKGLAAHEVGMGKTNAMVTAAMELRRLALARKPIISCLKANVEQITQEALNLYPVARILSTVDSFDAKKRKATVSRIATGDYDLVIMTHDHLNKLKMHPEVVAGYINDEIKELEAAIVDAQNDDPKKGNKIVKKLEKAKLSLEAKLKAALDTTHKDDAIHFEDTGCDALFVDEAHKFKALPCYTKQGQLKGVPNRRSDRATNMQMRTNWLLEKNGDRGVVFATGTPVTNTMAELFNMQRYLQPKELKERGVHTFDAWAATFGDVETKMEFTVAGEYKPVSRFSRFVNLPELKQMTGQEIDVQRADDLKKADGSPGIVRPDKHDHIVLSPNNPTMQALMASLQDRAKKIKGQAEKGGDNMLVICTDGRKGALDMRLLDPSAPDDPNSKTNQAVRNVLTLHAAEPGKTQIIFSDLGVHEIAAKTKIAKGEGYDGDGEDEEADEEEKDTSADAEALASHKAGKFALYQDIIGKLVRGGIPREKIADFSTLVGAKKEAAQAAMRRGEIVVAIGSTQKLGTGTNVQDKLGHIHHLDVPWLPADLEQRDGRGWRQGNENKDVHIHKYVAEGSLDQTFWQVIAAKTKFIKQVMTGGQKGGPRVAKDVDTEELTPEQLMAAASGDPRVLEKVNLDEDVKNLRFAEDRHRREQQGLIKSVKALETNIPKMRQEATNYAQDALQLEVYPDFALTLGRDTHTERKPAAASLDLAIIKAIRERQEQREWEREDVTLGEYRGFKVILPKVQLSHEHNGHFVAAGPLNLEGPSGQRYATGDSLQSIEHVARNLAKKGAEVEKDIEKTTADAARIKVKVGNPFLKAQELAEKVARSKQLEEELKTANKSLTTEHGAALAERAADRSDAARTAHLESIIADAAAEPGAVEAAQAELDAMEAPPAPKAKPKPVGTMPFGVHKGKPLSEVPLGYLQWAAGVMDHPGHKKAVTEHLAEREEQEKAAPPATAPATEPATPAAAPAISEEQRQAVHDALRQLHGNNADRAGVKNGVGFNKFDSDFGGKLAESAKLTDRQALAGARIVGKYKGQLGDDLHARATKAHKPAAAQAWRDEFGNHQATVEKAVPQPAAKSSPPALSEEDVKRIKWEVENGQTYAMGEDLTPEQIDRRRQRLAGMGIQLATAHAPQGGISTGGTKFTGGQFIPGNVLAQASPEEKAQLHVQGHGNAPGEGEHSAKEGDEAQKASYIEQAMGNLRKTSRTAGGVVDTSASAGKAAKIAEGLTADSAAKNANENFERVIGKMYAAKDKQFPDAHKLLDFCDDANRGINKGIVKDGVLLREDDSPKFPYTAIADLPLARHQFAQELQNRLADPHADPVETAAWIEWRANLTDHFWADGVGKSSKALGAWVLMRSGHPLPQYGTAKEMFAHANKQRYDPKQGPQSYLGDEWKGWLAYYRTLFPTGGVQMSLQLAAAHAPKGGVSIAGKKFTGGEFIPKEYLAKATDAEKAKLVKTGENVPGNKAGPQMAQSVRYSSPQEYRAKTGALLAKLQKKYPLDKVPAIGPVPEMGDDAEGHKAEMNAWLKKAAEHPYVRAAKKMVELVAPTDHVYKKDGKWAPEREQMHKQFIKEMLRPETKVKPGQRPKAVIVIGPPGAGKTMAGVPAIKDAGLGDPGSQSVTNGKIQASGDFVNVNADDAKAYLPEYDGWNAGQLHEESSDMVEEKGGLYDQAMAGGHNMILDVTGANGDKMEKWAQELGDKGYDVHLVHVKFPGYKSAGRVLGRFLNNPLGAKGKESEPGRYVPPAYAYASVDSKPDGTYDKLKNNKHVKSWTQITTDVGKGEAPKMLDHGKRGEAKAA